MFFQPQSLFYHHGNNNDNDNDDDDDDDKQQTQSDSPPFQCDLSTSIHVLYSSFLTWCRLNQKGIVNSNTLNDIKDSDHWKYRYPVQFKILHTGPKCAHSTLMDQGRYAKVYEKHNQAYKIVALNKWQGQARQDLLRLNIKELCFLNCFSHPHIVPCRQSQMIMKHGQFYKFIHEMPKARCNLSDLIFAQELTCFQDVVNVFRGLLQALSYMHKHSLAHFDVNPYNVLINDQGQPMLCDFSVTDFTYKMKRVSGFGTLFWSSPESILNEVMKTKNQQGQFVFTPSEKSDVWSLGVILLDCMYGCHYFEKVVHVTNYKNLLRRLVLLIGPPSEKFMLSCQIFDYEHDDNNTTTSTTLSRIRKHIQSKRPYITMNKNEFQMLMNFIQRTLLWNPEDRATCDELLNHPMFFVKACSPTSPTEKKEEKSFGLNNLLFSNLQITPTPKITSTTTSEKDHCHVRRLIEESYFQCIHYCDLFDWFVNDAQRLIQLIRHELKQRTSKYSLPNLVRYCVQFLAFLWLDYWDDTNPMFECVLFHVLHLSNFHVFHMVL